MKTFNKAKDAIEFSKNNDCIAVCVDSEENREYLRSECDDWTDTNTGYDYLTDAEGSNGVDGSMAWRVEIFVDETTEEN
jgi:hypothetical protein